MLIDRPRLQPLPVGWMVSPSVPHLQLSSHEDLVAAPTAVSSFATFADGTPSRVHLEFRDALWVRWSPSHSDLQVIVESDYDWSDVPRRDVGPTFTDSLRRQRDRWRAGGTCPDPRELRAMLARAGSASGDRWRMDHRDGIPVVVVERGAGRRSVLWVRRDREPASEADVAFIAYARDDLRSLVAAVRGATDLPASVRAAIAARSAAASPGPWLPFLATDGGIGGSDVIGVSEHDDEPDLYLWLDEHPAPSSDYEFVAHARDDIPRLLRERRHPPP